MNIVAEKEAIIKRIAEEEDVTVIYAVKELLDNDWNAQTYNEAALEKALDHAIIQSENNEGRPHEEVWNEIRKRYSL